MFITFTADDAIQSYTLETVKGFLGQRRNPNGCAPLMTYFTSLSYTNYSMVTDWYVAGNDIADHTMTHVAQPPVNEVSTEIGEESKCTEPSSESHPFPLHFLLTGLW